MRRLLPLLPFLIVPACGQDVQPSEQGRQEMQTFEAAEDASAPPPAMAPSMERRAAEGGSGPNVSPTAAPGVAFNYRYAFRLPAQRISQVQEQHARTCEQLGISRCRITGMRYRVVNERDIQAMLAFKLEPTLARRFGQAGAEAVSRAEGMLVDAEITGTDVGTSIRAAGRSIEEMNEELRRLEARLAGGGISRDERSRLEYEAQQLRQSIRALRTNQQEQQESLATTPMEFQYGSGDLVPGFDAGPSFRKALERAGDNFLQGVLVLLVIAVTLLPWAALLLLGWWIFRLVRRRWRGAAPVAPPAPESAPATAPATTPPEIS